MNLGDTLLIPANMLRSGEQVFLDDVTVRDVERALGIPVTAIDSGGGRLCGGGAKSGLPHGQGQ